jgi:hypothetical protein
MNAFPESGGHPPPGGVGFMSPDVIRNSFSYCEAVCKRDGTGFSR